MYNRDKNKRTRDKRRSGEATTAVRHLTPNSEQNTVILVLHTVTPLTPTYLSPVWVCCYLAADCRETAVLVPTTGITPYE